MNTQHIDTTTTADAHGVMHVEVPKDWIGRPLHVRIEPGDIPAALMTAKERHAKGLAAMKRLAARGGIKGIPDPVAWQRESREDRPLPGRE